MVRSLVGLSAMAQMSDGAMFLDRDAKTRQTNVTDLGSEFEETEESEEEPAPVEPAPVPAPLVAPIEELLDADTDGEDTDDEEVIKNKLAQILAMEDEDEDDADDED